MSLILNIDTATDYGSVCLSYDDEILGCINSREQKEHAAFVHIAVDTILREAKKSIHDISAIAVTSGPGSYTGLRVSMACAKGFCYALNIPLIAISTLKVMAFAALSQSNETFCCPMIDARRMEVFTTLYNRDLNELVPSGPVLLDEFFLKEFIAENRILFLGSGIEKYRAIQKHHNCIFQDLIVDASHLAKMAIKCYNKRNFEDITYAEPNYLKSFYIK